MPHLLPRSARFVLALAMLLAAAAAGAGPMQFGARSLNIPPPKGFQPVAAVSPKFFQVMQAYQPATNRLAEIYTVPADAKALAAGHEPEMTRYLGLGVMRRFDGVAFSEKEFQDNTKQIEAGIERAMENSRQLDGQIQQGNTAVERMTSVNPDVGLSATQYLGIYRREPWGLFFTMQTRVTAANSVDQKVVVGNALILVNRQLLVLVATAQSRSESDRRWAEQAVSAWANAIRAANPE